MRIVVTAFSFIYCDWLSDVSWVGSHIDRKSILTVITLLDVILLLGNIKKKLLLLVPVLKPSIEL